jgi:ankyrin repeat protein
VIQLMLADGVKNINQSDYQGFTALLTAANRGHWHVVNRILEHGRSIGDPLESLQLNHANDYGYTLAHYAAKEGSVEVLQFLQDAGADLNLRALDGHSPLSLAIESKGAEIAASYLESLGYTVEPEQPNEIQSRKGLALLFLAVVTNKNNLVKKILDQKTDNINQFTGLGFTALQLAASYCHWGMVNTILEHVRSLDNPRISLQLNHKNDYGYTLAHYAAEYGNIELLRYLKAAGADLNVKANDGFTPLSLASYYNHDDISRDIFDVPDQAEEESVSNQSENHTHTNAMLQSLATHFLGVSPGSKTRFVEFTTPEENDAPESGSTELPIHNKKKST